MIRSIKELMGHPVKATDGNIGKVSDFLFDDREWGLRYLVVDTGGWLSSRKVLVTPRHLVSPDPAIYEDDFPVTMTREEIEDSPPIEHDAPISRQFEEEFASYYGHKPYWAGWAVAAVPETHTPEELGEHLRNIEKIEESHLRSAREVEGYRILAVDGQIGKVDDLLLDTDHWSLVAFAVGTGGWLSRQSVLLNIDWIVGFDWSENTASVDLTMDQIESAPAFDPEIPVNTNHLKEVCDYFGRPYKR